VHIRRPRHDEQQGHRAHECAEEPKPVASKHKTEAETDDGGDQAAAVLGAHDK